MKTVKEQRGMDENLVTLIIFSIVFIMAQREARISNWSKCSHDDQVGECNIGHKFEHVNSHNWESPGTSKFDSVTIQRAVIDAS